MGDNGKEEIIKTPEQLEKEAEDATKPKVVIQIFQKSDGSTEMKSVLVPPMVVYIFMKIIFNLFMQDSQPSRVIPAKGGIMNFARRIFK